MIDRLLSIIKNHIYPIVAILTATGLGWVFEWVKPFKNWVLKEPNRFEFVIFLTAFLMIILITLLFRNRKIEDSMDQLADDDLPRKITFEFTLNPEDCYLYPTQSCSESFSHSVNWIHGDQNKSDGCEFDVTALSVCIVFMVPRQVDKVELVNMSTKEDIKPIHTLVQCCSRVGFYSGLNLLTDHNVGRDRLKLTVYFED